MSVVRIDWQCSAFRGYLSSVSSCYLDFKFALVRNHGIFTLKSNHNWAQFVHYRCIDFPWILVASACHTIFLNPLSKSEFYDKRLSCNFQPCWLFIEQKLFFTSLSNFSYVFQKSFSGKYTREKYEEKCENGKTVSSK